MKVVELENITMKYQTPTKETLAVDNISFSLNKGEFISIVGPSGCGKSTILSIIAGLLKQSTGNVYINGNLSLDKDPSVGYMLQKDYLFDWRNILDNVLLGLEIQNKKSKVNIEKTEELLKTYGLYDFRHSYPYQLSGGMRQRAALIRTLATQPEVLLLDEPFSALDYQTRLSVSDEIGTIIKKEKKSAILVSHDISEAISMADKVIVLTKRPAKIKSVYDIKFKNKIISPLKRRDEPEFKDYFNKIWTDLDVQI